MALLLPHQTEFHCAVFICTVFYCACDKLELRTNMPSDTVMASSLYTTQCTQRYNGVAKSYLYKLWMIDRLTGLMFHSCACVCVHVCVCAWVHMYVHARACRSVCLTCSGPPWARRGWHGQHCGHALYPGEVFVDIPVPILTFWWFELESPFGRLLETSLRFLSALVRFDMINGCRNSSDVGVLSCVIWHAEVQSSAFTWWQFILLLK